MFKHGQDNRKERQCETIMQCCQVHKKSIFRKFEQAKLGGDKTFKIITSD